MDIRKTRYLNGMDFLMFILRTFLFGFKEKKEGRRERKTGLSDCQQAAKIKVNEIRRRSNIEKEGKIQRH